MSQTREQTANRGFDRLSERSRVDLGSVGGLLFAFVCIVSALIFEGGKVADIQQGTAALIVFGGTIGAVLVMTPFDIFLAAARRFGSVMLTPASRFKPTLAKIIALSEGSRRTGVAYLESAAETITDPFFKKAVNLVADGTPFADIQATLETDLEIDAERAEAEMGVWESAGGYAPTFGIVGAVLGLIQVMKHLENLEQVGRGVAVAFVATVYGVASANLLFLPIAGKIRARDRDAIRLREMIIHGVLAISEGINPRVIQVRLEHFVHEQHREEKTVRKPQVRVAKALSNV